jgi:hypothetical protein
MVRGRAGPCIPGRAYVIQPDSASAPGHIGNLTNGLTSGLSGKITLRRGKTVIGTGSIASQPTFKVPASTLGTSAQATWTFRSRHVSGTSTATLPLWDVRISGAFNALDEVPAGKPFRLVIAPDLAPGSPKARITAITVLASFNDGKTWHRLALRPAGPGKWTTTVTPPKGTASFRTDPRFHPRVPVSPWREGPSVQWRPSGSAGMALAPHPPHGRAWAHASGSRVPSTAA